MQLDPWAFGWTQVLTLVGFAITLGIAFGGFRTLKRWKTEKIEEKRIECAFECLALAGESKYVFGNIRSPLVMGHEYSDMPATPGETEHKRSQMGTYYATFKRIEHHKDYFDRLWKLQSIAMSIFGAAIEDVFLLAHQARRHIEVAALSLRDQAMSEERARTQDEMNFYMQCRRDIWDHGDFEAEKDRVGKMISDFRTRMEVFCEPIVRPRRLDRWKNAIRTMKEFFGRR